MQYPALPPHDTLTRRPSAKDTEPAIRPRSKGIPHLSNPSGPSGEVRPSAVPDSDGDLPASLTAPDADAPDPASPPRQGTSALVLGAVGVVYGDIGTSPIYAFREAIKPVAGDTILAAHALGLLSLLIWTLILIVTVKYVFILLRADNRR